jgi:hypothetical protein
MIDREKDATAYMVMEYAIHDLVHMLEITDNLMGEERHGDEQWRNQISFAINHCTVMARDLRERYLARDWDALNFGAAQRPTL